MKLFVFFILASVFIESVAILIGVFKPIKKDVDK